MVEKMKKYSFLIYHKTYNEFLENIRQAGVVHIVEKQKGIPDDATDLRKQLATADLLKNTIHSLQRRLADRKDVVPKPADASTDGLQVLAVYEQLKTQDEQLKAQQQALQKEIDHMTVWGDFDPDMLGKLERGGRQIKFYSCREREFNIEWINKFDAVEIARVRSLIYFVTVTPVGFEEEPDAEKLRISDRSLNRLQTAMQENKKQVEEIDRQIDLLAAEHLNSLKETQRQLLGNIDLNKVHLQAEKKADERLILLEGWVPELKESELLRVLEAHDVYSFGKTPDKDDKTPPILLKNNRFSRLFEPIVSMYEYPNYHELDLTPFFAPFFMFFFGLCLGDAGYGLLIVIATLIARPKVKPALRPILSLATILGAATVFCAAIGGSFFGIPLPDANWAWLASYQKFMFDSDQMFNLALILGGIQIIFGMFVKAFGAIRRHGFVYSLETWGWLILILGGGAMYLNFTSENAILSPDTAKYLTYGILGVSGILIFILNTPGQNPLINIGLGFWNTFNMVTGLTGDLLSYIRLFALGLCGGVMGFVFNELAMDLSGNIPVLSHIIMLVILLIGHSLNIFMSCLGAFVHPLRLTFVEFYKNAGFEGGGKLYKPFKNISSSEN